MFDLWFRRLVRRSSKIQRFIGELVDAHNDAREAMGLEPLAFDPVLRSIAEAHAQDMAKRGVLGHYGFQERLKTAGLANVAAAENVAQGQQDVPWVMESWLRSPGHAASVLSSRFNAMGPGCAQAPDGTFFWCVVFAELQGGGLA